MNVTAWGREFWKLGVLQKTGKNPFVSLDKKAGKTP